jgi:hypothetical protein
MINLKSPELLPVIELSPFEYKKKRWKVPWDQHGEKEWKYFVLKCLEDSGITNIFPIESNSDFYEPKDINNDNLKIILNTHFKKHNMKTSLRYWHDRLGSFAGGLIIKDKRKIFTEPSCCCDIADIKVWKSLINEGNENWQYICIGHPETYGKYKLENNKIIFSYQETFSIKIETYKNLIKKAIKEIEIFETRLTGIIREISDRNDYPDIAYRLVKGFNNW